MSETPDTRQEFVPGGRAIWQKSDSCAIYQCPTCLRNVFTQYEGQDVPAIVCRGMEGHLVIWCLDGRFHEGESGQCVHCGLQIPIYRIAMLESEP